jgi:hypothetical protein
MNNGLKRVGVVVGTAVLVLLGTAVLAGAVAFSAGTVRVRVLEKKPGGENVNLVLPALAVPVGLKLMPDEARRDAAAQVGPWAPALEALSQELARTPDFVLVEVNNPREHVLIRKQGRSLLIDVDNQDETVHVSFPIRLMASVASEFDAGIID